MIKTSAARFGAAACALAFAVSAGSGRAPAEGNQEAWVGGVLSSLGKGTEETSVRRGNLRGKEPAAQYGSLSGGGVTWIAASGCVPSQLRAVIADVAANYGPVTVSSTCRGRSHNRGVGGAKHSYHLTGQAADFRVHARRGGVSAFLASHPGVGGLKHYGGGLYHIDTGPRRSW